MLHYKTCINSIQVGTATYCFDIGLHFLPYFLYASSEGSGAMHSLIGALAAP